MRRLRCVVQAFAATWLIAATAWAQSAQIQGRLVDEQGGAIPGAQVTAVDEEKGVIARQTTSGTDGFFNLPSLLRGRYTVRAELSGFKPVEQRGLVLDPGQVLDLRDVKLTVGGLTETIDVSAGTPTIEIGTSQKSYTISDTQIKELSLNGRDFTSLLKTLPGVATNDTGFRLAFNSTEGFMVNGLRQSMNNVVLDGTPNTDTGANDGQYTQLSLDAVGEFKLQNSAFNAEFGRNAGVLITSTTRSGGKQFRGTLYGFRRDGKWDAAPHDSVTGAKVPLDYNQIGGNIGGWIPIPGVSSASNKKLFFFFNHESTRAERPQNAFLDVFHPDMLTGDFRRLLRFNADGTPVNHAGTNLNVGTVFRPGTITRNAANAVTGGVPYPNNSVPQSEWNQNAQGFLNVLRQIYGKVNMSQAQPVPGNSPEFIRVPTDVLYDFKKDQEVVRVDYQMSASTNMFFRAVTDAQREAMPRGIFSTQTFPVIPMFREKPGQSYSFNLYNVVSPKITNEMIVGITNLDQVVDIDEGVPTDQYDRDALGFRASELYPTGKHGGPVNIANKFPNFTCGTNCGFQPFPLGWRSEAPEIAITDNLTWQRDSHTYKAGVFFNMAYKAQQPSWDMGTYNFSPSALVTNETNYGLANLLLGNYQTVHAVRRDLLWGLPLHGSRRIRPGHLAPHLPRDARLRSPHRVRGSDVHDGTIPAELLRAGRVRSVPGGLDRDGHGRAARQHRSRQRRSLQRHGRREFLGAAERGDRRQHRPGAARRLRVGRHRGRQHGRARRVRRLPRTVPPEQPELRRPRQSAAQLHAASLRRQHRSDFSGARERRRALPGHGGRRERRRPPAQDLFVVRRGPAAVALEVLDRRGLRRQPRRRLRVHPEPQSAALGQTITNPPPNNTPDAVRPFRGYTAVNIIEFGAESEYHGLQARLTRRFGQRFTANVGYTLSKALDHVDADNNAPGYSFDLDREWGPSGLDRRHQCRSTTSTSCRTPGPSGSTTVSAVSSSMAGRSPGSAGSGAASR